MTKQPLFGVLGDPHIIHRVTDNKWWGINELERRVKLLNDVKGLKYVLVTGDLSHNGKPTEFAMAKRVLKKLKAKCFCCAGNHDYSNIAEYRKIIGLVQYAVKIGQYNLLVLSQNGWMAFPLKFDRRLPSIALKHIALRIRNNKLVPSNVEAFLFKHNVKYVFQGHYHGQFFSKIISKGDRDITRNGIRYITCGASEVGIGRLCDPMIYNPLTKAC